jgi:hypothetical protein
METKAVCTFAPIMKKKAMRVKPLFQKLMIQSSSLNLLEPLHEFQGHMQVSQQLSYEQSLGHLIYFVPYGMFC